MENLHNRVHYLTDRKNAHGNIIYWMSREQRFSDNPGLSYASNLAVDFSCRLAVVFTLTDQFPGAVLRHYDFMINGLFEVAKQLKQHHIPFYLLTGDPPKAISSFIQEFEASVVVTDFDPLRIKQRWLHEAISASDSSFIEVDGHNVVPVRKVSDKVEYGAYTIRPKIHRKLEEFLTEVPKPHYMPASNYNGAVFDPDKALKGLNLDRAVAPVDWIRPGEEQAKVVLDRFVKERLQNYAEGRNDPNKNLTSDLSPYLHFGQIFSGRIVMEMSRNALSDENSEAFFEELIIRKELSDNFCHFNKNYDNPEGFPDWAKKTHKEHGHDERAYIYSSHEFEKALTHDQLWNAAQKEMVVKGKMHGYMRMYWAKKILEWTPSPKDAMEIAIYLNDKFELDGRDPNGYTGIAWSVGGVHDRAWQEREVYGKIRYMNYNGCKRKFDVENYIRENNVKLL